jgi:ketosteroid isomerase-like protein
MPTFDELTALDFVYHHPGNPDVRTHEQRKQKVIIALTKVFPDIKYTLEDTIAEGDKVAIRYLITGTQKGEFMGIPPTNKRIELSSLAIARVAKGKVAELWVENNSLVLLQQLGVIPLTAGNFYIKQQGYVSAGA